MKQEKICISKSVMIFAAVAVFLLGFVVFTNYLNSQKVGQKPRASEPEPRMQLIPNDGANRKISCPADGKVKFWKQTDDPPTYFTNSGVCSGSDNYANAVNDASLQVCCNEEITQEEYLRLNPIPTFIPCPVRGERVEYSYGPEAEKTCYKINGQVLFGGTENQVCGNLKMPDVTCCENSGGLCQGGGPSVAPTAVPTSVPVALKCPPTTPYVYKYLVGTPGTNFSQSGCYLVEGMEVVDASGKSVCSYKKMEGAMKTACCGSASLPGCQPTPVPRYDRD